jgi:DNA-binding protein H-NS
MNKNELEKLNIIELEKLEILIKEIKEIKYKQNTEKLINELEKLINKSGVPLDEILPKLSKGRFIASKIPKSKPKYANPENKNQKWSGKGKTPSWAISYKKNNTLDEKCLIS